MLAGLSLNRSSKNGRPIIVRLRCSFTRIGAHLLQEGCAWVRDVPVGPTASVAN